LSKIKVSSEFNSYRNYWEDVMKFVKTVFLFLFMVAEASAQSTVGALGTPPNGSTVSGISAISGYHCTSHNIEVFIDGVSYGPAGAGTQILGTQGVCGRTDTGFSFLYNFSNLPNGVHTVSVTADGVPFGTNTVTTVNSGGEQFLTGVSKQIKIPDFPHPGQAATLDWAQSYQNFLVSGIGDTANDLSSLNGSYLQSASISVSGGSCYLYDFLTGTQQLFVTFGASADDPSAAFIYVVPYSGSDLCFYALASTSGNSGTGYSLDGIGVCAASGVQSTVVGTGVMKSADGLKLLGTMTSSFPGCTQTAVLN
jgi:hypothetical protein